MGTKMKDSEILQPFSLTSYVDKDWADHLRIGTTFNCFTKQSGSHLATEPILSERKTHSESNCRKVESLECLKSAYALSPSAALQFMKLIPLDFSFTTEGSNLSREKRSDFLYSHIIKKEIRYLNTIPDTRNATESCTHYVDSVVYGGYMFVHLSSKTEIDKIEAQNIMQSGISFMGQAGLSASTKNHSESTESQLSHHIISSIPINVFSKDEDIVRSFISKYEKEETDLTPIAFHFQPLPGVKLQPYYEFSQSKCEQLSLDVEGVKKTIDLLTSSAGLDSDIRRMFKSQLHSIQGLSSAFTKIENKFHVKEDFVGIDPTKAVQDYNLLLKKFREDLKNTKDVGKDVGELSTLQAYLGEVKSCAGLSEATDALGRLIMKHDTVTGTDEKKVILLIGKVGQGKSSVGNFLAGDDFFKVSTASSGVTQKIEKLPCKVMGGKNETLIVYDTPGFLDVNHHSKVATSEIKSEWSTGVHAFVWVLRSDFPDDVDRMLNKLKQRLFEGITEHMIVAFTYCEDPNVTTKGLLDKHPKFKELSNLVGQRVIGIRSKNPKDVHNYERQETLKALLNLVNIIDKKRGKYIPPREQSCVVM